MEINTSRTRDTFLKHMTGKCFGCGSTTHSKKMCVHAQTLCSYCGRTGHREGVCEDKYRGRPKKENVVRSATIEEVPEAGSSSGSTSSPAIRNEAMEAQIAALLDSQKLLQDQLAALQKAF